MCSKRRSRSLSGHNAANPFLQICERLEARLLLTAQSQLVFDANPDTFGSDSRDYVTLGDHAYFFAEAGDGTVTLWKTDGTSAGTVPVKAGFYDGVELRSGPLNLSAAGGRLYFSSFDAQTGTEPWVSDGTAAGTTLLRDVYPGIHSNGVGRGSSPGSFSELNGQVFFTATTDAGRTVWVTDGTADGTRQFVDLNPASTSETLSDLTASAGRLFVFSYNPGVATQFWGIDGAAAEKVRDLPVTNNGGGPVNLTDVNGTLFFAGAPSPGSGRELWKSDGTAAGTVLVKDIRPGQLTSELTNFTAVGGKLFFSATDTPGTIDVTRGLWVSDGTAAGTTELVDRVNPSRPFGITPEAITDLAGVAVFFGFSEATGGEVWRSDGTVAGTRLVSETIPGPLTGVEPGFGFQRVHDRLYFAASTPAKGRELWVTDGSAIGTRLAVEFAPGPADGIIGTRWDVWRKVQKWTTLGDRLVLHASGPRSFSAVQDGEPWITDGTPAGTSRLIDIDTTGQGSTFRPHIDLGDGKALVNANGRLYGVDLAANVPPVALLDLTLVRDPVQDGERVGRSWANLNGVAVFAANGGLYRSDGTPQGTYHLRSLVFDQTSDVDASPFVVVGSFAYFVAAGVVGGGGTGRELWRTDGTVAGTTLVRDVAPGTASAFTRGLPEFAAVGDTIYFRAFDNQLWKSDGTEAGTQLVRDFGVPVPGFARIANFAEVGGRLLLEFPADIRDPRSTIWTSDGTPQGTVPVPTAVRPNRRFTVWNGDAYFWGLIPIPGTSDGSDQALYRTDGTAAGTVRVSATNLSPSRLTPAEDFLYFITGPDLLWRTNGTLQGTVLLPDINLNGNTWSNAPVQMVLSGGSLYFFADDGVHGKELWRVDPLTGLPELVEDLYPGPTGSGPEFLMDAGGTLLYAAADPQHGMELRRIRVNITPVLDTGPASRSSGLKFAFTGSFVDPGGRSWSATVNYGDGSGDRPLALGVDQSFSLSHVYAMPDQYAVTVSVRDDDGAVATGTILLTVHGRPRVTSILVNGGGLQRSKVNRIVVQFDQPVTLSPGAAALTRRKEFPADPASGSPVSVTVSGISADRRSATLSFSGPGVAFGSLIDGVYDLTIAAAGVLDDFGQPLSSNVSFTFHRLFADANGNANVGGQEQHLVRNAIGAAASRPASGYQWYLDYDADGDIDRLDWREAQRRLAKRYLYKPASPLLPKLVPARRAAR